MTVDHAGGETRDWVAEHVDYLSGLAARNNADPYDMAMGGANALWNAASYHAPELLVPAKTLLTRVAVNPGMMLHDASSYLSAKLANAFFAAHEDWAHGRYLHAESVAEAHGRLTDIIQTTLTLQQHREAARYLLVSTYMAQLTRTGDTSPILFPAPPDIQINGSGDRPPHNAFAAVDSALVPCHITAARFRNASLTPQILGVYAGDGLSSTVYQAAPDHYRTYAHLPPREKQIRSTRFVAQLMLKEADRTAEPADIAFLGKASEKTAQFLRSKV